MSLIKQLAGETVLYGLGQILPRIFHFLVFGTYLTYRLQSAETDYAIYLDLYAYTSILIVLFSYRMDTAMFRFGKGDSLEKTYLTALWPMFFTSALLLLIGHVFAEPIAQLLTYPGRGYYVKWFSWIIALDVLSLLPMARLRLESRAKRFVLFKVLNVALTVLLVLLCLEIIPRWRPDLLSSLFPFTRSIIDFVFLSNLVASTVMFIGLMITYPLRRWNVDWSLWSKMVRYAWPLIIVGIAGSINMFFAVPLQKTLLGEDILDNKVQSAIYGAAQRIPTLLAMFTTAYNYAAEPFFFRNADRSDAQRLYGDIALFFVMIAGVFVLGLALYIDIFQLVIGESFRDGLFIVPFLLVAYVLLGLYYNVSIWYKLSDHTHYGAIIASIGAVITLSVSYMLLPRLGIIASAYAAIGCYATMVVIAYLAGQAKYPIQYPVASILQLLAAMVILMVIGYSCRTESLWQNVLIATVLILMYLSFCYFSQKKKIQSYFGPTST